MKKGEPFLPKDCVGRLQLGQLEKIEEKGTVIRCGRYLKKVIFVKLLSFWRREKLKSERVVKRMVQDVVEIDFFRFYARIINKVKQAFICEIL